MSLNGNKLIMKEIWVDGRLPIREWVLSEARELSVHPEYILMPLIASLGGLIAHKIGVYPKESNRWCETTTLWCLNVGTPSTRKTQGLLSAKRFVQALSDKAVEDTAEERNKKLLEL